MRALKWRRVCKHTPYCELLLLILTVKDPDFAPIAVNRLNSHQDQEQDLALQLSKLLNDILDFKKGGSSSIEIKVNICPSVLLN